MLQDVILYWNQVSLDVAKVDFDFSATPDQAGPTRLSRAFAITHLAMYDAWQTLHSKPTYGTYGPTPPISGPGVPVAVANAAAQALSSLFPRQTASVAATLAGFVAGLGVNPALAVVAASWGKKIADSLLASRDTDGWNNPSNTTYVPSGLPGSHDVDPTNPTQSFLDPHWGAVRPFGIDNLVNVVPGSAPPALPSALYGHDYRDVVARGSASTHNNSPPLGSDQFNVGTFWAYDGSKDVGLPPRLYNQILRAIVMKKATGTAENAALFAMANVAMADAGIQCWHEKYVYDLWRPILGVQRANAAPGWAGDSNPATVGDPNWIPLGAPRSNQPGVVGPTPNFPSYPSGHATFGTAAIEVARRFLNLPPFFHFDFQSDETNGATVGFDGQPRPALTINFTVDRAIAANVQSRVWLGVHWSFDCEEGQANGKAIAKLIVGAFPKLAV